MAATRRRPTRRQLRNDVIIAAALGAVSAVIGVLASLAGFPVALEAPAWVFILTSFAMAAPLAIRHVLPWLQAIIISGLYIVLGQLGLIELTATQVIVFLSFYTVGAWDPIRRRAFWVRLLIVIAMAIWLGTSFTISLVESPATTAILSNMVILVGINAAYFGGAWVFGDRTWRQAVAREALEDAHGEIVVQREQLTEQAVALERLRIARELHDVVAHHVSAMGVQAGAARRTMRTDADRAEQALRSVEQSARDAIAELRTMVVALRSDGDASPMPTIADIDGLLDTARDSGQTVRYQVIGEPVHTSPIVAMTIVRVLQEALTNARKHAGPAATVDARLRYDAAWVEVEVSDDGHGTPSRAPGTGMGLTGMRERVAAAGGELTAGARSNGGWLVRARVPVQLTDAVTSTPEVPAGAGETIEPADAPAPPSAASADPHSGAGSSTVPSPASGDPHSGAGYSAVPSPASEPRPVPDSVPTPIPAPVPARSVASSHSALETP